MRKLRSVTAGASLMAIVAAGCGGPDADQRTPAPEAIRELRVGATQDPESQIVAQMYVRILEDADFQADVDADHASQAEILEALEAGRIDVAPLYLASLARELDPEASPPGDPFEARALVDPLLDDRRLEPLDPSSVNSGEGLVVSSETTEELGLRSVGDLASAADRLTLGGPAECRETPTCLPGLAEVYGVEFGRFRAVGDPADALEAGAVDVAIVPATSARIREERWVVLEDDRALQPAENVTPVVRREVLTADLAALLNAVSASLDRAEMIVYNRSIEFGEAPGTVAILHLNNERLLGGVSAENAPAIGDEPPAGCTDARGPGVVEITALDRAFSTDCLIVSGDQRISLVNEDSLPHTLTITGDATYSPPFLLDLDESLGKQTLTSEPVDGSVEPGGWPFVCRYHTWMAGQIWVR